MTVRLQHIVIDAHDLPTLARFWTQVLGWPILSEREREIVIGAEETAPAGICFMPAPDQKIVKNRGHLDLTSGAEERDAEIERILALGAAVGLLLPPGDVGIVHPFGATRFYRHGWTSWRPTAWWPLTRRPCPALAVEESFITTHDVVRECPPRHGGYGVGALDRPERPTMVSHPRQRVRRTGRTAARSAGPPLHRAPRADARRRR